MSISVRLKQHSAIVAVSFNLAALSLAAPMLHPLAAIAQTQPPSTNTAPTGCVTGYPDGTYRGDRPITRNEFAAGMNACLESVNQTLPFNRADYATRADLEKLIERQRELNQQLRDLNDRVSPTPGSSSSQS